MTTQFRGRLQRGLAKLPFSTAQGRVDAPRGIFPPMGYRPDKGGTGIHPVGKDWCYRRNQTGLMMYFCFSKAFTADDLHCKVYLNPGKLHTGMGASVQFNDDSCMKDGALSTSLSHHGRVNCHGSVKRSDLASRIGRICPREMALAGIGQGWPVTIGDTRIALSKPSVTFEVRNLFPRFLRQGCHSVIVPQHKNVVTLSTEYGKRKGATHHRWKIKPESKKRHGNS